MPLLRKIADCLGIMYQAPSRSPSIANSIAPVATPELAFGWSGSLSNDAASTPATANAILGTVAITEDCFYAIDAACVYSENPVAGTSVRRIALEVLDLQGLVAWQLVLRFLFQDVTAVGEFATNPVLIPTLYMHLLNGMTVRFRNLDAGAVGSQAAGSLALRKLYQDQL